MILFKLILALFIPTYLGVTFIQAFDCGNKKLSFSLVLPVGFALGFAFLSHWMLILSILGIKYSQISIGLPFILLGTLLQCKNLLLSKTQNREFVDIKKEARTGPINILQYLLNIILLTFIIYTLFFVWTRALTIPILNWDAISWIALKAKIFFYEQRIYDHAHLPNSAYPMHVSLSLTWIAINIGEWHEIFVKIIFPAYLTAYCMIHYTIARVFINKLQALASLAILLSSSFFIYHSTIAYRDIILMFYLCSAILLITLWSKIKYTPLLIFSSLFLGFCTFVKLEGALYMCLGICLLSLVYLQATSFKEIRNYFNLLYLHLISITIFLFYYIYKLIIGAKDYTQNLTVQSISALPEQSLKVIKAFYDELFLSANWHIIWFIFALTIIRLKRIRQSIEACIILTSIFLFFGIYFFLGSTTGLYESLLGIGSSSVISRITIHIFPLAVFFISLTTASDEN